MNDLNIDALESSESIPGVWIPKIGRAFTILTLGFLIAACAQTNTMSDAVDTSVSTFDGLHPLNNEYFEQVYVQRPLALSQYTSLMLKNSPEIYSHPNYPGNQEIMILDETQISEFEFLVSNTILLRLSEQDTLALTDVPSPETLMLWGTLVNINVHKEGEDDIGEFVLVMELRDSLSRSALVRVIHPYRITLDLDSPQKSAEELLQLGTEIGQTIATGLETIVRDAP